MFLKGRRNFSRQIFSPLFILITLSSFLPAHLPAQEMVRVKDLAYISGVRENQLVGFGLVTGLSGKGDSDRSVLLKKVLSNFVSSFGLSIGPEDIRSRNCAVVMVTAEVPAFVRPGDRISVTVSSVGDATSLTGGILLQTNLKAANGSIYAVAQGMISSPEEKRGSKTVGIVPAGAIIEREVLSEFMKDGIVSIILREPDFSTAAELAQVITETFEGIRVLSKDASLIEVAIPADQTGDPVQFIAELEKLEISPDVSGKVVINPRSGVVVYGKDVKIGKVAVSYKGDNISVGTSLLDNEKGKENFVLPKAVTVDEFIQVLQEVGLATDTIIEILKGVEKAGALYGKLVIM